MSAVLPGHDRPVDKLGGHWILARVGKKVLRPGGRETTDYLLAHSPIAGHDVIEFAPGLGVTAAALLERGPASYVGVDADPHAAAQLQSRIPATARTVVADCAATGLPAASADVVIGEAMLTMQTDRNKLAIMREAHRLLRPGGVYAIHEMGLAPEAIPEAVKVDIRKALARSIRVNSRPLTLGEWARLADEAGFDVVSVHDTSMGLLDPTRMLADEGVLGTVRIIINIARQPDVRRRVLDMRRVFLANRDHLRGVGLILRKR
ncbi:class I SAM-dependent methyltransferase [Corynebacterium guangdongense]|uniref:SAM-dependent methyltransferase n=1 Tax=Corynebacterium guangdongense TaxID=1783348 RepID=A0ABU2A0G0_9CORY|nr:class I SAM-dependent methyltransferase [Corynebacterium guangdongense]MDR7329628.1 SAM-dependent methyltransferase [Corynebacterium guangdongense]WJZ18193.1 arsenite S-adenosylmethyltransferase [Corynebacterium guangdongense]